MKNKTFEKVVELIKESRVKRLLKLLVVPNFLINYGNPDISKTIQNKENIFDGNQSIKSKKSNKFSISNDGSKNASIKSKGSGKLSLGKSNEITLKPTVRLCTIFKVNPLMHLNLSESKDEIGFNIKKQLNVIHEYPIISSIKRNSPAFTSGLQVGDIVLRINDRDLLDMPYEEALEFIKYSFEINNHVKLLVASSYSYNWYKSKNLISSLDSSDASTFSYVDFLKGNQSLAPRLCQVKLPSNESSFGIKLHSTLAYVDRDNNKLIHNHVISKISSRTSAAIAAGLRTSDRIIEVDGLNVEGESSNDVMNLINASLKTDKCTTLLVVDHKTDIFFREREIELHGLLPIVQHITNSNDV